MATTNSNFDDCAARCGVSMAMLLAMQPGTAFVTGRHQWTRLASRDEVAAKFGLPAGSLKASAGGDDCARIAVGNGAEHWVVDVAEIARSAAQPVQPQLAGV